LTYDANEVNSKGELGVLKASTRKGATLKFDKLDLLLEYHENRYNGAHLLRPRDPKFYDTVGSFKIGKL
jgi:hypothetical protein